MEFKKFLTVGAVALPPTIATVAATGGDLIAASWIIVGGYVIEGVLYIFVFK